jgi:hypothetical protein
MASIDPKASVAGVAASRETLSLEDEMDLHIILSQSPEAAFYQMDSIFSDNELFSTGADVISQRYHSPKYLATRDFYSFLSSPPPCLSTIAMLFQSSLSRISSILDKAAFHGFILTGIKQTQISEHDRTRFTSCDSNLDKTGESIKVKRALANVLTRAGHDEPVVVMHFSKENGVKELVDIIGIVTRVI